MRKRFLARKRFNAEFRDPEPSRGRPFLDNELDDMSDVRAAGGGGGPGTVRYVSSYI